MSAGADRTRLMRVAQELATAAQQPPPKQGRRRLPVVAARDAAGLVEILHEQLDQAIAQRTAFIAEGGMVLACGRGCTACCTGPVVVGEAEAVAVAVWLDAHPEVRERFRAAYQAWRAALGALIEEIFLDDSDEGRQRAAEAFRSRRAMCPFNEQGDCTIYPVRPALCRTTHALETRERCSVIGGQIEALRHPAVEGTYERQHALRSLLQRSLEPGRRDELLPKAVVRRLTLAAAAPNQPCACGSGRKHKRCCGTSES
ncbi:MAG: SEC-C metal-binding domain-containing protein [Kofleriaceae bacterium]